MLALHLDGSHRCDRQLKTHLTVYGPSNPTTLPFWGQKPRASSPILLPKRGTPRLLGKRTRESHQSFSCQPEPPGLELSFLPTPLCTQGAKFPLGSWKAEPAISFVLTVLSLSVTFSLSKTPGCYYWFSRKEVSGCCFSLKAVLSTVLQRHTEKGRRTKGIYAPFLALVCLQLGLYWMN